MDQAQDALGVRLLLENPATYVALEASEHAEATMNHFPYSPLAFLARFSIAAVFWQSGQTKVQGFAINIISSTNELGWPQLADGVVDLFESEYKLPWLSPELAATLAALGEHVFPVFILLGLATRWSALALLAMTLVIQLLVYPGAYATHGVWASVLLLLISQGLGKWSLDHWLARKNAGVTENLRAKTS